MATITKQPVYYFTVADNNYRNAINYNGVHYYNAPITITIDRKLFILPFGEKDKKTVTIEDTHVYIVATNESYGSIGLTYINLTTNLVDSCFFSENDLRMFGNIFELPTWDQIGLLSNYLNY